MKRPADQEQLEAIYRPPFHLSDHTLRGEWRLWWRTLRTGIDPAGRSLVECVELLAHRRKKGCVER